MLGRCLQPSKPLLSEGGVSSDDKSSTSRFQGYPFSALVSPSVGFVGLVVGVLSHNYRIAVPGGGGFLYTFVSNSDSSALVFV